MIPKLLSYQLDAVVAIPRGGVEVAAPIAKARALPLALVYPRKIRAPKNPEYAIGAVCEDGEAILDEQAIKRLGISKDYLTQEINAQRSDISQRITKYPSAEIAYTNKSVLLVDDGIATGYTMLAACHTLMAKGAKVTVAVPVASRDAYDAISKRCDIIALHIDDHLGSVGSFYQSFNQTDDEVVIKLLQEVNQ